MSGGRTVAGGQWVVGKGIRRCSAWGILAVAVQGAPGGEAAAGDDVPHQAQARGWPASSLLLPEGAAGMPEAERAVGAKALHVQRQAEARQRQRERLALERAEAERAWALPPVKGRADFHGRRGTPSPVPSPARPGGFSATARDPPPTLACPQAPPATGATGALFFLVRIDQFLIIPPSGPSGACQVLLCCGPLLQAPPPASQPAPDLFRETPLPRPLPLPPSPC